MVTSSRKDQIKEANARWIAAEDAAHSYLMDNFPGRTRVAIATSVEFQLAARWKAEQEVMRERGDSDEVLEIPNSKLADITSQFAAITPDTSDKAAEWHVMSFFAMFRPDEAWWSAHKLRDEMVAREHWTPVSRAARTGDANLPLPPIDTVIVLPLSVRTAARAWLKKSSLTPACPDLSQDGARRPEATRSGFQ
jgi:hypothetical protein